jgi:hypothetical protein
LVRGSGAALAYYTIFAITPGLVIVMALAGLLLGPGAERQIIEQIHELIGEQGAKAIEGTVRSARASPPGATGWPWRWSRWCSGSEESSASYRTVSTHIRNSVSAVDPEQ